MTVFIKTGLLVVGCICSFTVSAFEIAQEFSAEAVQSVPGRPTMNGNKIIEIVYAKEKRRILLNQARKTYIEQKAQNKNTFGTKKRSSSPCEGIKNATCKKLGGEKINGRKAIKWEMTAQVNGKKFKSLYWQDKKYHMPLREQLHDGTIATGKHALHIQTTDECNVCHGVKLWLPAAV